MTKNELNKLREYHSKFLDDCFRVANVLSGIKRDNGSIGCAKTFTIVEHLVKWTGMTESWEDIDGYFPLEYLTFSNQELQLIVDEDNKLYQKEKINQVKSKILSNKEEAIAFMQEAGIYDEDGKLKEPYK